MVWLTLIVFIPIYTGFIGLFCIALRQPGWPLRILTGLLTGISPLILSGWNIPAMWLYAIIVIFLLRSPTKLPLWVIDTPLKPHYWGLSMLLIALWGVFDNNLILSIFALIAAFYALSNPLHPENSRIA